MGTLGEGCVAWAARGIGAEAAGDDVFDIERRCVGCEYNSCEDESPIRLSTDNPSYVNVRGYVQWQK